MTIQKESKNLRANFFHMWLKSQDMKIRQCQVIKTIKAELAGAFSSVSFKPAFANSGLFRG